MVSSPCETWNVVYCSGRPATFAKEARDDGTCGSPATTQQFYDETAPVAWRLAGVSTPRSSTRGGSARTPTASSSPDPTALAHLGHARACSPPSPSTPAQPSLPRGLNGRRRAARPSPARRTSVESVVTGSQETDRIDPASAQGASAS